jgi:ethanolamine utilization microcompartment shell protein EutS
METPDLHCGLLYDAKNIVTRMSDFRRGFGLNIGFIDHFNTQFVITFNYKSTEHTLSLFQPVASLLDIFW